MCSSYCKISLSWHPKKNPTQQVQRVARNQTKIWRLYKIYWSRGVLYKYFIPTPTRFSVRCIPKYDFVEMYSWKRKSRYLWHYTISLGNSLDDKKLASRDLIVWYTDMCPIPAVRSHLYDVLDALHKYLLLCFVSWQR